MKIHVDGIHKATRMIQQGWPTHIISITNAAEGDWPATTIDRAHADHHIYEFHDVEDREDQTFVVPSREVIGEILDTAQTFPQDAQVLIHCTAGKSRSTAIALGVQVINGMTPAEAFLWLRAHRPVMFPNRLIVEYVDDHLGLGGELISIVETYYRESLHMFPKLVENGRGGYNR